MLLEAGEELVEVGVGSGLGGRASTGGCRPPGRRIDHPTDPSNWLHSASPLVLVPLYHLLIDFSVINFITYYRKNSIDQNCILLKGIACAS